MVRCYKLTCTFVGNSRITENIEEVLRENLIDLIENRNVDTFLVGNHGRFDSIVYEELEKLKEKYSNIKTYVVVAYKPSKNDIIYEIYPEVIYPKSVRFATFKSAIPIRNKWMIEKSDMVLCYVKYKRNAFKFVEMAKQKGKEIIDITF